MQDRIDTGLFAGPTPARRVNHLPAILLWVGLAFIGSALAGLFWGWFQVGQ